MIIFKKNILNNSEIYDGIMNMNINIKDNLR